MIFLYLGGIGSGKTLSAIKYIVDNHQFCYTNFAMKNYEDYHRIKFEDIIKTEVEEVEGKRKPRVIKNVNWDFWEKARKKHNSFSIVLDEVHNIMHSRTSMTKTNILMSKWISQIRKILSDHPENHLILISQKIRKIDVDARELAQAIIQCKKIELDEGTFIIQDIFGDIDHYMFGRRMGRKIYRGEQYFKYYDMLDLVTFEDAEQFI